MPLVLSRYLGETIVVDGRTLITVEEIRGGRGNPRIVLSIIAPDEVVIDRYEIHARKQRCRMRGEGRHPGEGGTR
jgi:sRNA-binding carbon storage regulator CsrA